MLDQLTMLVEMLDVDAALDEHFGQQLRPVTVRWPCLAAHQDEPVPLCGS